MAVPDHEKIGIAVQIIVAPSGPAAPSFVGHTEPSRNFRERAVSLVVVQTIRPALANHKKIGKPIAIIIAPGRAAIRAVGLPLHNVRNALE